VRAVVFTGAGGNEVVSVVARPDPVPAPSELLVAPRYTGVNPADVLQREGRYPAPPGSPPDIPGLEVAGRVVGVGDGVTRFGVGDRVLGIVGGGGLADRVLLHERCAVRVPEALDDRSAAAVPEAYLTAHDAVRSQAGLTMGETLLVQGATGGVGVAAVQIGVAAGARVLAVVRRPEARDFVTALGATPVDDSTFADTVQDLTDGRGADVVLELVGAPHFPGDLAAGAVGARIVVVGVGAGADATLPLLQLMQRRQRIIGTVLRARPLEEKAMVARAFEREVLPALARGEIIPRIETVLPAEQVTRAFEAMAGPGRAGKLLLDFGEPE
jgi:putative PIG3 family NAD(P)H quinone oxidoreductase